jgi:hypothetical protein
MLYWYELLLTIAELQRVFNIEVEQVSAEIMHVADTNQAELEKFGQPVPLLSENRLQKF